MATGDMADGKRHGQYGQTKGQRDPQQTNPHVREGRSQHGTAAPAQDQPERTHKLSSDRFHIISPD